MGAPYPRQHRERSRSRRAPAVVFAANRRRAARLRRRPSPAAGPPSSIAAADRSSDDENLESTVDQALAIERHRLRIHHVGQPRVFHDLGVHAIAMRARLVHDPREHHGFAALELHAPRKRRELSDLHVVAYPFLVVEGAVFPPDFSRLLGHAPVRRQVFQRYRYHKAVNVAHEVSKFVGSLPKTVRGDEDDDGDRDNLEHDHLLAIPPLTIQGVPKRSTSMPNASAQKVFCKGMVTRPAPANASNTRFASATDG